ADAGSDGTAARIRHCAADRAGQRGRAATEPGDDLRLAAPPAAAPLDCRQLGRVRQQPQGEVLRDHQDGAEAAGGGDRELATDCGRHRTRAATGGTVDVPAWLAVLSSRMRGLVQGRRLDNELRDEIASHLEALTEENIRRGMAPDEARRAARLRF